MQDQFFIGERMLKLAQNCFCFLFFVTAISAQADTKSKPPQKNFLIHISGTPGTGKTTLGKKLKDLTSFQIIETDSFTSRAAREETEKMLKAGKNEEDITKYIFQKYRDKFFEYNSKFSKIIYIGLLNSNVPKGKLFKDQPFDVKIYYDPGLKEVIRRYYNREVKEGILTDEIYLDEVVSEKAEIRSSKQIRANYEKHKEEHRAMNYQIMNESQIVEYIKKLDHELKKDL